jgi:ribosomal protein S27E
MVAMARDFCAGEGIHRASGIPASPAGVDAAVSARGRALSEISESACGRGPLPRYVEDEFEAYLKCGRREHGFLRVKCESCQAEKLVAFSCKRRGFCPSCGARRMAETASLLVDDVLLRQPVGQWVLSLPFAL